MGDIIASLFHSLPDVPLGRLLEAVAFIASCLQFFVAAVLVSGLSGHGLDAREVHVGHGLLVFFQDALGGVCDSEQAGRRAATGPEIPKELLLCLDTVEGLVKSSFEEMYFLPRVRRRRVVNYFNQPLGGLSSFEYVSHDLVPPWLTVKIESYDSRVLSARGGPPFVCFF